MLYTVSNRKKFIVRTNVGGCAQGLCASLVRRACARRVVRPCVRSVGWLCVGIVRSVVRNGCAQVVRKIGPKSCALQAAQGFCLVQDTSFRTRQGFGPCAAFFLI